MLVYEIVDHLAMDKPARLTRAKTLGFDTTTIYYHGTGQDFMRFSPKFHGSNMGAHNREIFAVWLTTDPEVAAVYANHDRSQAIWWGKEEDRPRPGVKYPNLMPLFVRLRNPKVIDCTDLTHYGLLRQKGSAIRYAKQDRHDSIVFRNAEDGSEHRSDIVAVFNPRNVRSVFARFDPAKQATTDLMA